MQLLMSAIRNARSYKMNRAMIGYTAEHKCPAVTQQAIREFARATCDDNPVYDSPQNPAPPFFLGKLIIPLIKDIWAHRSLELNLLKTVQISQSVTWFSPIRQGDEIFIQACIEDIRSSPRGEILEISGAALADERVVVQGSVGFLVKSNSGAGIQRPPAEAQGPELFRLSLSTLKGQQLLYAKASGDNNFIHTSPFLARMAGLPRPVMHGACTLAMTCNALTKHMVDGDITRLESMVCQFGKPVFPGETLTIVGYGTENANAVHFSVFSAQGKSVFREGVLTFHE